MKYKALWIFLIISVASNFILSHSLLKKDNGYTTLNHQLSDNQSLYKELRSNISKQYLYEQQKVNNKLVLSDGDSLLLDTVLGTSNKLIFRFSETSCNPCIQRELQNISYFENKFGFDKIIIIASYEDRKKAIVKLNNHNVQSKLICLSPKTKLSPFEGDFVPPYLFLLNRDLKMKKIFFTLQTDGQLSSEYFNVVARLL